MTFNNKYNGGQLFAAMKYSSVTSLYRVFSSACFTDSYTGRKGNSNPWRWVSNSV